ncbi:MAG: thioredoxin domain-containing protein [Deltaproteobacteria bacterium]|nr:thioredoxin domain-containing protein [Deltaproteobacteria bacterium]
MLYRCKHINFMLILRKSFIPALVLLATGILTCWVDPSPGQTLSPPPGKPTIIEFSRPLCPICKEMEAILLEVKARYRDQLEIRFVYRDPDERLFKEFHIIFVPTQVFLDASGKEVYRNEGIFPKEKLLEKLKELRFIRD